MKSVIKHFIFELTVAGLSQCTIEDYVLHIKHFINFSRDVLKKKIFHTTSNDVHTFLYHIYYIKKLSYSTYNKVYCSLHHFFISVLSKPFCIPHRIRNPYNPTKATVLSVDEIYRLINAAPTLLKKLFILLGYASGLRINECLHIKIHNINRETMRILVDNPKGRKERYVILAEKCLDLLDTYLKNKNPCYWLFPGSKSGSPLSVKTCHFYFAQIKKKAKINPKATFHSLRHSFATHLLNAGVSIFEIKNLLGHSDLTSTFRYLHVTDKPVISPLDEKCPSINDFFDHKTKHKFIP